MCGIAGIISLHTDRVSPHRLKAMADALAHRGPDGEGFWTSPDQLAGLAHRRLAIIDTSSTGAQPMHYLDRYSIVYNGEIYNYRELRNSLQKEGFRFYTQSDTEVILAAYAHFGNQCLRHFDGMFALAIWDRQEQLLFGARDRMGEKPLFLYQGANEFLFASEMKALWAAGAERQPNYQMLFNFLTLGYTQNPNRPEETFFRNIIKLPAHHAFEWRPQKCQYRQFSYWNIDPERRIRLTDHEAIEQFRELLDLSVRRRLCSDVPVGSSLSGGIDSSTIVATCAGIPGSAFNHEVFTCVFPGFAKNEAEQASAVAREFGCRQSVIAPNANGLAEDWERLLAHQEEPFGSASVYAQYKVFELASRKQVTVLLDGQGADETLAGYSKYLPVYWQQLYQQNRPLLHSEKKAMAASPEAVPWTWKNRMAARLPLLAMKLAARQKISRQRHWPQMDPGFIREYGHSYYQLPRPDSLQAVLHYNSLLNGLEELLRLADRNSMGWGREVRLPFLFHELVELVFALPDACKIRDGYGKWILRKSMEPVLDANILWQRQKIGFEPPQENWMEANAMADWFATARQNLVRAGIMQPGWLQQKIKPHTAYAAQSSDWKYLVAGTWLQG